MVGFLVLRRLFVLRSWGLPDLRARLLLHRFGMRWFLPLRCVLGGRPLLHRRGVDISRRRWRRVGSSRRLATRDEGLALS